MVNNVLKTATNDLISCVKYSTKTQNLLAISSWDSSVTLLDTNRNKNISSYKHNAAVLDVAYSLDDSTLYRLLSIHCSAGLDQQLIAHDINTNTQRVIGIHDKPIKSVSCIDAGY
jgi:WD40 repeat protein